MTEAEFISRINANRPAFLRNLGGEVTAMNRDEGTCSFEFNIGTEYCHSVDIIQGGFVTAMLDSTMTHAVFGFYDDVASVASLEIKVSFLEPSRAGRFTAVGKVLKAGRNTVFLTGELYNEAGELTATGTTTAKLIRSR
jgi:uncharacterized protein (TIGR00369 family)